jgi:hydroxymethylbilane synthase
VSAGRTLVVGTRGSRLALRQTDLVLELLRARHPGLQIDVREIRTEGDRRSSESLATIGGLGLFVKALEAALVTQEIDFAVHSLKDVPSDLGVGLVLAAMPERADPRDALVTRDGAKLADLPSGARIGTGSERRAVQLRTLRSDIQPADIRGNVDTRVRKVDEGEFAAAVLAVAGLERLGLGDRASEVFDVHAMTPAVGQGALAIEARADDAEVVGLLSAIDHAETRRACEAERAFMQRLGGGCNLPFGALGRIEEGALELQGFISDASGERSYRGEVAGRPEEAQSIGVELAELLLAQGASELIAT